MSKNNQRPSKLRQKADRELAGAAARKNKFGTYNESLNPYKAGLQHDRFKRYYEQICRQFHDYEPVFMDLCEVYGFDPKSP